MPELQPYSTLHDPSLRPITHAAVIAFDPDRRMPLSFQGPNREFSFPKGEREPGESPEETATREFEEETGIPPELLEIVAYGGDVKRVSNWDGREKAMSYFAALILERNLILAPQGDENGDVEYASWFLPEEGDEQLHNETDKLVLVESIPVINRIMQSRVQ